MRDIFAIFAIVLLFSCSDDDRPTDTSYVTGVDAGSLVDRPKVLREGTVEIKDCCTFVGGPEDWERPASDLTSWYSNENGLEISIVYGSTAPQRSDEAPGDPTDIDGVKVYRSQQQEDGMFVKKMVAYLPVEKSPDGLTSLPPKLEIRAMCSSPVACERAEQFIDSVRF